MLFRALSPSRTVQALRQPAFRWYLIERVVGGITWALRGVARGWLVYSLTGSVVALASVEAVRAVVGIAVAPFSGVLNDRFEKRLVLLGARLLLVGYNLVLALLIWLNVLQMWQIIVATIFEGIAFAAIDPALQSIVPELVSPDLLLSATSLTFVVEGVFTIIGAFAAGLMIDAIGVGSVFFTNALLSCVAVYALARMPKGIVASHGSRSLRVDVAAGLSYLRTSSALMILLALAFARMMFMQPYNAFLPAFARDNLGFDAAGLGSLTAVAGIGALAGALLIAARGDRRDKGRIVLGSGIGAAAAVVALMITQTQGWPFLLVALAGGFAIAADILTRTLMQTLCEPSYRGRVAGLASVLTYLVSLWVIPAGVLAQHYSVPLVVGAVAALVLLAHLVAALLLPSLRRLD